MEKFGDFLPDTDRNNYLISKVIQDSDFHVLISALAGMSEEIRQMFYRNVSQRVRERLVEEVVHKESIKTPENQVQAAQEHLLQLFQKWIDSDEESTMPKPDSLPPMPRLDTKKDIIETFKTLASFCRTYGFIVLEEYAGSIDHPVMKKGLEMLKILYSSVCFRPSKGTKGLKVYQASQPGSTGFAGIPT